MAMPAEGRLEGIGAGRLRLSGELTFSTVSGLWRRTDLLLQAGPRVEVDLSGVTRADSAGLALLVGWLSRARAAQVELRFTAVPERLVALARISEAEGLLGAAG